MRMKYLGCAVALVLAGCQTAPPQPEALRAACVAQAYLRTNGFLDTAPARTLDLFLTSADTQNYERADGRLDFERLVKDRRNRFTGKLAGVRLAENDSKYVIVYGKRAAERQCLGVVSSFAFAYFIPGVCEITPPFVRLRENALGCGP